ncbi:MAG: hypothetical protein PVG71_11035, partial [Anaerolineae bacterium]
MKVNIESEDVRPHPRQGALRHTGLGRLLTVEGALRVALLGLLIVGFFAVFTRRVWHLQFVQGQEFREEAEKQSTKAVTVPASRGIIYDRSGERLVRNVPSFTITVVPAYLPDDEERAREVLIRLAVLLGVPYTTSEGEGEDDEAERGIREMIEGVPYVAPYRPVVIKRNVDRKKALLVAQEAST